jgi:hypothetical protein
MPTSYTFSLYSPDDAAGSINNVTSTLLSRSGTGQTSGTKSTYDTYALSGSYVLLDGTTHLSVTSSLSGNMIYLTATTAFSPPSYGDMHTWSLHYASNIADDHTVTWADTAARTFFTLATITTTSPTDGGTLDNATFTWTDNIGNGLDNYLVLIVDTSSTDVDPLSPYAITATSSPFVMSPNTLVAGHLYVVNIIAVHTPDNWFVQSEDVFFMATAAPVTATRKIRLVSFIYSAEIAYTIEMGEGYMRFFYDGAVLLDGSSNEVWITTPYLEEHLFEICCGPDTQVGDEMWFTHPSYPQMKLKRTSATEFTLETIVFDKGPFLPRNDLNLKDKTATPLVTMASSATEVGTTGVLTLANNQSFAFDDPGHVGALFKLWIDRANALTNVGTSSQINAGDPVLYSTPILARGLVHIWTEGVWGGQVIVEKSIWGGAYMLVKRWTSTGANLDFRNFDWTFEETEDGVHYRVGIEVMLIDPDLDSSDPYYRRVVANISLDDRLMDGIVRVTAVTSDTQAAITVVQSVISSEATLRWQEGAWSPLRGYPASVAFLNGRCIYGGNTQVPDGDPGGNE